MRKTRNTHRRSGDVLLILCGVAAAFSMLAFPRAVKASEQRILGLRPSSGASAIAVPLHHSAQEVVTSLRWFHNDETVTFPRLVLMEGTGDVPPALSESGLVLASLSGASLAWGEWVLEQPVTTTSGIMYAILVFPEGEPLEGVGSGGGAGIGLEANSSGEPPFFISRDGEDWVQFDEAWTVSLRFETVALARSALAALVLGQITGGASESDTPAITRTVLYSPSPNPFNPSTQIHFDLASAARVRMTIYDIRGRRVRCHRPPETDPPRTKFLTHPWFTMADLLGGRSDAERGPGDRDSYALPPRDEHPQDRQ